MYTLDFETRAIVDCPFVDAPEPVGLAVKHNDKPSAYVTGMDNMYHVLYKAVVSREPLLFHNAPFDLSVMDQWWGFDDIPWDRVHDTQYLVYLHDPHAKSVALKDSAARILHWDIGAKDELQEWILDNIPKVKKSEWGAHIADAPLELVSKYARQDTDMTYALYQFLHDKVPRGAYDRERRLAPHLVESTAHGIRVATGALEQALERAVEKSHRRHHQEHTEGNAERAR